MVTGGQEWEPSVTDEPAPRMVTCDCGAEFALDSPEESDHYVWAARMDGSRSNLGYCPIKWGTVIARSKARAALSGMALYHGRPM